MLLSVGVGALPARAQPPASGFQMRGTDLNPALQRRHLERYAHVLGLSEDQLATLQILHEGLQERLEEILSAMMEKVEALQEEADGNPMAMMKGMAGFVEKMQADLDGASESFFDDMRMLLTPAQEERWPSVERLRRRLLVMQQLQTVAGAQVDLTTLAYELDLESNPAVAQQLRPYELDVDRELASFEKRAKEQQEKMFEAMEEMDFGAMGDLLGDMHEIALSLREINKRHLRKLTSALPGEDARRIVGGYRSRAFPDVFGDAHVHNSIRAAEGFSDLSADQRERLAGLAAEHEREASPLNEKWMAAIEKEQSEPPGSMLEMGMRMGGMGPGNAGVAGARGDRAALDARTLGKLREILTAAQIERLPAEPQTAESAIWGPDGPIDFDLPGGG